MKLIAAREYTLIILFLKSSLVIKIAFHLCNNFCQCKPFASPIIFIRILSMKNQFISLWNLIFDKNVPSLNHFTENNSQWSHRYTCVSLYLHGGDSLSSATSTSSWFLWEKFKDWKKIIKFLLNFAAFAHIFCFRSGQLLLLKYIGNMFIFLKIFGPLDWIIFFIQRECFWVNFSRKYFQFFLVHLPNKLLQWSILKTHSNEWQKSLISQKNNPLYGAMDSQRCPS